MTPDPQQQSWASLPDSVKRQAAPDMLDGGAWAFYGRQVQHPGIAELRRWLPLPEFPPARSNADKRRAVAEAVKIMPRASTREIARMTGTSHRFVALLRRGERRSRKEKMETVASQYVRRA